MQIVIEISEKIYNTIMADVMPTEGQMSAIVTRIYQGKPLPANHGDLIDRDALELDADWNDYYDGFGAYSESQVRCAPIIIEEVKADDE